MVIVLPFCQCGRNSRLRQKETAVRYPDVPFLIVPELQKTEMMYEIFVTYKTQT